MIRRVSASGKTNSRNRVGPPIDMGTAMWKLYLNTDDCEALHATAVRNGITSTLAPLRPEQWPVTIAFLADPDGYQVELVERDRE